MATVQELYRHGRLGQQLRDLANQRIEYKQEMMDSLQPVKVLLSKMFDRLFLAFKTFSATSADDIKEMWKNDHCSLFDINDHAFTASHGLMK
uniref:Uncharacterized protein n=1 Tax=Magallana gigas TaxID=29159 RepID=K1QEN7_MAGGI